MIVATAPGVLLGFPLQPNRKGEGQGVVQALGIMREPPLHGHPRQSHLRVTSGPPGSGN